MPGSHPVRWIIFLCGALAAFGCANTDTDQGATGSLSLDLVLADDIQIDVVDWEITGNGMDMGGSVDVSAPGSTASIEVFGLPVGEEPYLVELSAVSVDQQVTCRGSAEFDIEVGVSMPVMVILRCKLPQELGSVRVNGKFNICAQLTKATAAPLQTSVGNDIDLTSQAEDAEGDPIAFNWAAASGSIDDASAASTTYTCTEAGDHTITISVTDNDDYCDMATWTFPITCVPGEAECQSDADCGAGELCVAGRCVPDIECNEDSDCDAGEICVDNECVPDVECILDSDCDMGEVCVDNACVPEVECTIDDDCGTGEVCVANECVPDVECIIDDDCPMGEVCVANECVPDVECAIDDDCPMGEVCVANECVPDVECTVDADCPATGNECIDPVCNAGTCGTSNNTNACENDTGTCNAGVCVTNPECTVDTVEADCPATGNECIDPVCNAGVCETSNNTNACDGGAGTCNAGVCEPNAEVFYDQNFNLLPLDPGGVIGDGWLYFINVFADGGAVYRFGFGGDAPQGPQISDLVTTEGGPEQEPQQLVVFSQYDGWAADIGHNNPTDLVETNVFQERTIGAADVGKTFTFVFQAKGGNLGGSTTANGFIKTLRPPSFGESAVDRADTTGLPDTWGGFTVSITIPDNTFIGDILQFGFQTNASNFEPSGNFYDNVLVTTE